MDQLTRIATQYLAFKYDQKESKQSKVDRLAIQKAWPIVDGMIEGPSGSIPLTAL